MKLDFFLKLKIQTGVNRLKEVLTKLDQEDFKWLLEQFDRVEMAFFAEIRARKEREEKILMKGERNGLGRTS